MTVFANAKIITMSGGRVIPKGFLAIDPPYITHIGDISGLRDYLQAHPPADVVNLAGKVFFPGMINCHHHVTMHRTIQGREKPEDTASVTLRAARTALKDLRHGVTAVRVLGNRADIHIPLRNAIEAGAFPGPRMKVSGDTICMSYGQAHNGCYVAHDIPGLIAGVRKQISAGADLIKLIGTHDDLWRISRDEIPVPWMSLAEMSAAVDTAHEAGLPVTIHANGLACIDRAISAGVDCVEHAIGLDRKNAARMHAKGIALTPTLSGYFENAHLKWGKGARAVSRYEKLWETHRKSIGHAVEEGVQIAAGTDALGDIVTELRLLMEAGMSVQKALESATIVGARLLGLETELGSLEPGKYADFLVLSGDPLENLDFLSQPEMLVVSGKSLLPETIDLMLPDLPYMGKGW